MEPITITEQLSSILDGMSNKLRIIDGVMLPSSTLAVMEENNISIDFSHFREDKGSFEDAIIDLSKIVSSSDDFDLNRYFQLYHWSKFLAVSYGWTHRIENKLHKKWLDTLKKVEFTKDVIETCMGLMDETLLSKCPVPVEFFDNINKEMGFYWSCDSIEQYTKILEYNKLPTTEAIQHIWFTTKERLTMWWEDPNLQNRTCQFVFANSLITTDNGVSGVVKYFPDSVTGDLTMIHFDGVVEPTKTIQLPDITGGMKPNSFNSLIGKGDIRIIWSIGGECRIIHRSKIAVCTKEIPDIPYYDLDDEDCFYEDGKGGYRVIFARKSFLVSDLPEYTVIHNFDNITRDSCDAKYFPNISGQYFFIGYFDNT
jgi:hypothetical protein